jgi:hypothetical protein
MRKIPLTLAALASSLALVATGTTVSAANAGSATATHKSSIWLSGCSEDPNNWIDMRKDVYRRGIGKVESGPGSVANFEVDLVTRYYVCHRPLDPDKILINNYFTKVIKLDNNNGYNNFLHQGLEFTALQPDYWASTQTDPTKVTGDWARVYWNGNGSKGDTQSGAIQLTYAATDHWIHMDNGPVVQTYGWLGLNNMVDYRFVCTDVDTGSTLHQILPYYDPVIG